VYAIFMMRGGPQAHDRLLRKSRRRGSRSIFIVQDGPSAHHHFVGFVGDSRALTLRRTAGGETKPNRPHNATRQTREVGSICGE